VSLLADTVNLNPAEGGLIAVFIAIYVAIIVTVIVAWVKIVSKAGYSGWWVLAAFVPLLGIVMFVIFAFSEWPVLQELRALRSGSGSGGAMAMSAGWPAATSPAPIQSEGPPIPPPPPS